MDPDKWESLDHQDGSSGVMVSNLPLLFAYGLPTALNQMSLSELELFVPFMVRCSVGVELNTAWSQLPRPLWWPNKLPFRVPSHSNSSKTLVKLIERCYAFHGSSYLLEFCASLLQMRPTSGYRFTDNRDGTTSMFHGSTGKLLVTFRNENRDYDKVVVPKPTLSQKKLLPSPTNRSHGGQGRSINMVSPPITDVYLCDKCDEEFSLLKEVQTHEKTCKGDRPLSPKMPSPEPEIPEFEQDPVEQVPFLSYLGLKPSAHTGMDPYVSPRKKCQTPAKVATFTSYLRFDTVPICSPMGSFILKHCKYGGKLQMPQHQVSKYERYVYASCDSDLISTRERTSNRWVVVWKKKDTPPWVHLYSFNRDQRKERLLTIETGLNSPSRGLLSCCKRVKVKLKRLSKSTIDRYKMKEPPDIVYIDLTSSEEHDAAPKDPLSLTFPNKLHISPLRQEVKPPKSPVMSCSNSSYVPPSLKKATQNGDVIITPLYPITKDLFNPRVALVNSVYNSKDAKFCSNLANSTKSVDRRSPFSRHSKSPCSPRKPSKYLSPSKKVGNSSKMSGINVPLTPTTGFSPQMSDDSLSIIPVKPKDYKNIEVIDLSSDEETPISNKKAASSKESNCLNAFPSLKVNRYSENFSSSKNGYSHWSPMESFSLHGRSVRDLAANGMPLCSVPPSPSKNSSTNFVFRPSKDLPQSPDKVIVGDLNKEGYQEYEIIKENISNQGITLDDEISFKSPLQVDEEISFSFQNDSPCFYQMNHSNSQIKIEPSSLQVQTADSFSCSAKIWEKTQAMHSFDSWDASQSGSSPLIPSEKQHQTANHSQAKSKSFELKQLLRDECRELGRMGLDTLREVNFTSKKRLTRFSLEKNNFMHTRKKRYLIPTNESMFADNLQSYSKNKDVASKKLPFLCPNSETFSTTKPVLQSSSHLTCIGKGCSFAKEDLELYIRNPNLLTNENNNNSSNINKNNDVHTIETKPCLSDLQKEPKTFSSPEKENKSEVFKKRRRSLSGRKRTGLSREISMLIRDECKEINNMGFHPTHILGASYSDHHYDDDRDLNSFSPSKKKSLLSYSKKVATSLVETNSVQVSDVDLNKLLAEGEHVKSLSDNKHLKSELKKLMNDEWKELKKSGHHPSQIPVLLSSIRSLRSNEPKDDPTSSRRDPLIPQRRFSLSINLDYSLTRSTRQQAKMLSCVDIETPRSAHRELIRKEPGMCVVNYALPIIR